jgi:hypothetical protein
LDKVVFGCTDLWELLKRMDLGTKIKEEQSEALLVLTGLLPGA